MLHFAKLRDEETDIHISKLICTWSKKLIKKVLLFLVDSTKEGGKRLIFYQFFLKLYR